MDRHANAHQLGQDFLCSLSGAWQYWSGAGGLAARISAAAVVLDRPALVHDQAMAVEALLWIGNCRSFLKADRDIESLGVRSVRGRNREQRPYRENHEKDREHRHAHQCGRSPCEFGFGEHAEHMTRDDIKTKNGRTRGVEVAAGWIGHEVFFHGWWDMDWSGVLALQKQRAGDEGFDDVFHLILWQGGVAALLGPAAGVAPT